MLISILPLLLLISFIDGTFNFRGGEESFGFKKLYITRITRVWTLAVANRRRETTAASFAKQVNKIRLLKSFICKEVALSELNLLRFAYYHICSRLSSLFPGRVLRLACSLMATGKPIYATARPWKFFFVETFALYVINKYSSKRQRSFTPHHVHLGPC